VRFHAFHFSWLLWRDGEFVIMFGIATGRVPYAPTARWLYSFRVMLGACKVELLWQTGTP
jgi:hypothetical protein